MGGSFKKGFSFGLTSGIITTLGLMVGLYSGTHSRLSILGGILTIAVADAFSDALGIHLSEESEARHSYKEVWESTLATFFSKFIFALSFILPFLIFDLTEAVLVCLGWGMSLLGVLSYFIAKQQKESPAKAILEHLMIAFLVILSTNWIGKAIFLFFN